ncbi:MAG: T9SS type A sorting domain-containing protein, partial [Bacteroidia bacterium]
AKYWYAIGTTAGGTDVLNWTDNGLNTSVTSTGLSLITNQLYYISVKAENGAGLLSDAVSSDGQLINTPNSVDEYFMDYNLGVYPNPFNSSSLMNYTIHETTNVEVYLTDMLGKKIVMFNNKQTKGKHTLELDAERLQLAKGIYVIGIKTNREEAKLKVVVQ